jgi:hypothetical protein
MRFLYRTTLPPDPDQRASRGFKLKWGRADSKLLQYFAALVISAHICSGIITNHCSAQRE